MKTRQFETQVFSSPITRSRFLLSSRLGHRLFAVLFLAFVALVAIASTTGGKHSSSGANLMLAPGQPGHEPALY